MSKFNDIFTFLKKRKKLLEKYHKAQSELTKIEDDIKELEKPFYECGIDIEKYRKLFENYYIVFDGESKYTVKKIELSRDYENKPFYETTYLFEEKGNQSEGKISLRKFLHLLDYPNSELKEKVSK